jgi:hypothetical protein
MWFARRGPCWRERHVRASDFPGRPEPNSSEHGPHEYGPLEHGPGERGSPGQCRREQFSRQHRKREGTLP